MDFSSPRLPTLVHTEWLLKERQKHNPPYLSHYVFPTFLVILILLWKTLKVNK